MKFNLQVKSGSPKEVFTSNAAFVVFIIDDKNLKDALSKVDSEFNLGLNAVEKNTFLEEKEKELKHFNKDGRPDLFILAKLKLDEKFNPDFFRNYFAGLIKSFKWKKIKSLHVRVPGFIQLEKYFTDEVYYYQTIIEGCYLGNYTFDNYKSEKNQLTELNIRLHTSSRTKMRKAIASTESLMDSVNFAKDLVNEPAIKLTPQELAKRASSELKKSGVKVTVFNQADLRKKKMNAILAVGSSSSNLPKLIVMHYKPSGKIKKKIALVGKGVTYDSGGLSLKPTEGMVEMKADMAGAGAVIGIIKAASMLKLPVEITGVVPAVENMVSGNSYKPGDIISTLSGKTIEVGNTDAEGRVVLADALEYACKQKPAEIIDFATLTGACVVALGQLAAGVFTKNDAIAEALMDSGSSTYERVWRLPMWDDYKPLIESKIADIKNVGPRYAGAITAAKFLEYFVDKDIPWAHVDLAGPAIKYKHNNYTDDYDTGYGVRLIIDYLSKI